MTPAPHLFLCAGEASSDRIAADLMAEVRAAAPGARFSGFGGTRMVAAGLDQWYDLPRHSIMWAGQALRLLPEIYGAIRAARARLAREPADAFVLVDNPGINFFFAKTAKARGIPSIYYVGPQLWGYNPWRIAKVRRWVDRMLVILPFEEAYYRARGVAATYVGNPLCSHLAAHPPDTALVSSLREGEGPVVGLLPGSRGGEMRWTLPILLRAAERLSGLLPGLRFVLSCAKPSLETAIRQALDGCLIRPRVIPEGSAEIYTASDVVLATSGTVTLEAVWHRAPVVIVYRVGLVANALSLPWRIAPFIGLPNLVAGRRIVPEFAIASDRSADVANAALLFLTDPRRRAECVADLDAARTELLRVPDPSKRAAAEVLATIEARRNGGVRPATLPPSLLRP